MTACEKACKADMKCAVWQFLKPGDNPKGGCWYGYPWGGCRTRDKTPEEVKKFEAALEGGQRLQHGTINVLSGLKGVKVEGLTQKFDFVDKESILLKKERCKQICYSDTTCNHWQTYEKTVGADKTFTCYVEHLCKPHCSVDVQDSKAGKTIQGHPEYTDGQKIEHVCPPWKPPAKKKGLPWKWIIPGILLGLLSCCGIMYCLQKKPKVKKTRAMKIADKPEPEPVVTYFVPQPTMLIPQQSVIISQPVVQQPLMTQTVQQVAAPVQTVQMAQVAAPTTAYAAPTTAYAAPTTAYAAPTSQYTALR